MSISCDCSAEGYDGPDVFREEHPTARKSYKCCECGGEIRPGQKYHKETGLWEGRWETHRTCEPCSSIRDKYCPRGWIYGELQEAIYNCLGFDYTEVPEPED